MSWSPDLFIGEFRPWPDTVHVVRGKTDEMRRYVPEDFSAMSRENVRLRELARDMWRGAMQRMNYAERCEFAGEFVDRMRVLEVDA